MTLEILQIAHPMIRETRLPHRESRLQPKGKSALDELHGSLQGDLWRGRQQSVHMIGHNHEFMQKKLPLITIFRERLNKKSGACLAPKDRKPSRSNGGYEENAIGIHLAMLKLNRESCL